MNENNGVVSIPIHNIKWMSDEDWNATAREQNAKTAAALGVTVEELLANVPDPTVDTHPVPVVYR